MKIEGIKFCWLDLGEGKVCERAAGHDGECSPDPTTDFPVSTAVLRRTIEDDDYRRRLEAAIDSVDDTGFSSAGLRERLRVVGDEAELGAALRDHFARLGIDPTSATYDPSDVATWTCPHCNRANRNPNDVKYHYCGACHHYCDEVPPW